eukprot:1180437-Prorocentrum_minimum.AAC.6
MATVRVEGRVLHWRGPVAQRFMFVEVVVPRGMLPARPSHGQAGVTNTASTDTGETRSHVVKHPPLSTVTACNSDPT